jgi:hypothetical protein
MFNRARCGRRLLSLVLFGLLLLGTTRWAHQTGYREGFARATMLAAGNGQAVEGDPSIAPAVAFPPPAAWGIGPLELFICALPLTLFGASLLLYMLMAAAASHRNGAWAHGPGGKNVTDDIGPEKQPSDIA